MTRAWTKADAWYRRNVGNGSYLTVSRNRAGSWSWRWSELPDTSCGPFNCAREAMFAADEAMRHRKLLKTARAAA